MIKDYIAYGIGGIVLGLVLGFYSANWFGPKPVPGAPSASTGEGASSVISPGTGIPNQELPPNHPPIDAGRTVPAPPLPADAAPSSAPSSAPHTATSDETQLPSLDPLPASSREERAEHKFKNIQLLKGLPEDRLMSVMFAFKASLGVECTHCHIKDQFEKDDKPPKQVARKMITLVRETNAKLGGAARVTCFTCHRGQIRPAS